jgi:hypothetical protein
MLLPAVPVIVVAPVFVTVDAARTPYVEVVPWRILGPAAEVESDVKKVTIQIVKTVDAAMTCAFDNFVLLLVLISEP